MNRGTIRGTRLDTVMVGTTVDVDGASTVELTQTNSCSRVVAQRSKAATDATLVQMGI